MFSSKKNLLRKVPTKVHQAKQFLIKHPYATTSQVMRGVNCSYGSVKAARGELLIEARDLAQQNTALVLDETYTEAQAAVTKGVQEDLLSTKEVLDAIDINNLSEALDLTPIQMKTILSRIMLHPELPPQVKVLAINAKMKLDFETKDKHELGPGAPLSRDDATHRLSNLIRACGPALLHDAITMAFEEKEIPEEIRIPTIREVHAAKKIEIPVQVPLEVPIKVELQDGETSETLSKKFSIKPDDEP